jgi:tRNA-dihydrouridine synthase 1
LGAVKALKDTLGGRHAGVKVVSNGNVGTWDHIVRNREETGADGMMVGESILGNPWFVLFASLLSFVSIAL